MSLTPVNQPPSIHGIGRAPIGTKQYDRLIEKWRRTADADICRGRVRVYQQTLWPIFRVGAVSVGPEISHAAAELWGRPAEEAFRAAGGRAAAGAISGPRGSSSNVNTAHTPSLATTADAAAVNALSFKKKSLRMSLEQFCRMLADCGIIRDAEAFTGRVTEAAAVAGAGGRDRDDGTDPTSTRLWGSRKGAASPERSSVAFAGSLASAAAAADANAAEQKKAAARRPSSTADGDDEPGQQRVEGGGEAGPSSAAPSSPSPSTTAKTSTTTTTTTTMSLAAIEASRVTTLGNAMKMFGVFDEVAADEASDQDEEEEGHQREDADGSEEEAVDAEEHQKRNEGGGGTTTLVSTLLLRGKGLTRRYLTSTHAMHTLLTTFGDVEAALTAIFTPITASMAEELFLFAAGGSEAASFDDFVVMMAMLGTFLEPETESVKGTAAAVEVMCKKHFARYVSVSSPLGIADAVTVARGAAAADAIAAAVIAADAESNGMAGAKGGEGSSSSISALPSAATREAEEGGDLSDYGLPNGGGGGGAAHGNSSSGGGVYDSAAARSVAAMGEVKRAPVIRRSIQGIEVLRSVENTQRRAAGGGIGNDTPLSARLYGSGDSSKSGVAVSPFLTFSGVDEVFFRYLDPIAVLMRCYAAAARRVRYGDELSGAAVSYDHPQVLQLMRDEAKAYAASLTARRARRAREQHHLTVTAARGTKTTTTTSSSVGLGEGGGRLGASANNNNSAASEGEERRALFESSPPLGPDAAAMTDASEGTADRVAALEGATVSAAALAAMLRQAAAYVLPSDECFPSTRFGLAQPAYAAGGTSNQTASSLSAALSLQQRRADAAAAEAAEDAESLKTLVTTTDFSPILRRSPRTLLDLFGVSAPTFDLIVREALEAVVGPKVTARMARAATDARRRASEAAVVASHSSSPAPPADGASFSSKGGIFSGGGLKAPARDLRNRSVRMVGDTEEATIDASDSVPPQQPQPQQQQRFNYDATRFLYAHGEASDDLAEPLGITHAVAGTSPNTTPSSSLGRSGKGVVGIVTATAANGRPLLPAEAREAALFGCPLGPIEVSDVLCLVAIRAYGLPRGEGAATESSNGQTAAATTTLAGIRATLNSNGGANASPNNAASTFSAAEAAAKKGFNLASASCPTNADLPTPCARYLAFLWDLSSFFRATAGGRSMADLVEPRPPQRPAISNFTPKVAPLFAHVGKGGSAVSIVLSGPREGSSAARGDGDDDDGDEGGGRNGFITDDPNLVLPGHFRLGASNNTFGNNNKKSLAQQQQQWLTIYGQNFPASGVLIKYESTQRASDGRPTRTNAIIQPSSRVYVSTDGKGAFVASAVPIFGRDTQQFTVRLRKDVSRLIDETAGTALGTMLNRSRAAAGGISTSNNAGALSSLGATAAAKRPAKDDEDDGDDAVAAIVCYQREVYLSVSADGGHKFYPFAPPRAGGGGRGHAFGGVNSNEEGSGTTALAAMGRPPGDLVGDPLVLESPAEGIVLSPAHLGRLQIIYNSYRNGGGVNSSGSSSGRNASMVASDISSGSLSLKAWARFSIDFGLIPYPQQQREQQHQRDLPRRSTTNTAVLAGSSISNNSSTVGPNGNKGAGGGGALVIGQAILRSPLLRVPFERYAIGTSSFSSPAIGEGDEEDEGNNEKESVEERRPHLATLGLPFNGFVRAIIDLLVRSNTPLALGLAQFLDGRQWLRMRENLMERHKAMAMKQSLRGIVGGPSSALESVASSGQLTTTAAATAEKEALLAANEPLRDLRTLNLAIRRAAKLLPLDRRPSERRETAAVGHRVKASMKALEERREKRRRRRARRRAAAEQYGSASGLVISSSDDGSDSDADEGLYTDSSSDSDSDGPSRQHQQQHLRRGPAPVDLIPCPSPRINGIHPLLEMAPIDKDEFVALWDDPLGTATAEGADNDAFGGEAASSSLDVGMGQSQRLRRVSLARSVQFSDQQRPSVAAATASSELEPTGGRPRRAQSSYPKGQWVNDWLHGTMIADYLRRVAGGEGISKARHDDEANNAAANAKNKGGGAGSADPSTQQGAQQPSTVFSFDSHGGQFAGEPTPSLEQLERERRAVLMLLGRAPTDSTQLQKVTSMARLKATVAASHHGGGNGAPQRAVLQPTYVSQQLKGGGKGKASGTAQPSRLLGSSINNNKSSNMKKSGGIFSSALATEVESGSDNDDGTNNDNANNNNINALMNNNGSFVMAPNGGGGGSSNNSYQQQQQLLGNGFFANSFRLTGNFYDPSSPTYDPHRTGSMALAAQQRRHNNNFSTAQKGHRPPQEEALRDVLAKARLDDLIRTQRAAATREGRDRRRIDRLKEENEKLLAALAEERRLRRDEAAEAANGSPHQQRTRTPAGRPPLPVAPHSLGRKPPQQQQSSAPNGNKGSSEDIVAVPLPQPIQEFGGGVGVLHSEKEQLTRLVIMELERRRAILTQELLTADAKREKERYAVVGQLRAAVSEAEAVIAELREVVKRQHSSALRQGQAVQALAVQAAAAKAHDGFYKSVCEGLIDRIRNGEFSQGGRRLSVSLLGNNGNNNGSVTRQVSSVSASTPTTAAAVGGIPDTLSATPRRGGGGGAASKKAANGAAAGRTASNASRGGDKSGEKSGASRSSRGGPTSPASVKRTASTAAAPTASDAFSLASAAMPSSSSPFSRAGGEPLDAYARRMQALAVSHDRAFSEVIVEIFANDLVTSQPIMRVPAVAAAGGGGRGGRTPLAIGSPSVMLSPPPGPSSPPSRRQSLSLSVNLLNQSQQGTATSPSAASEGSGQSPHLGAEMGQAVFAVPTVPGAIANLPAAIGDRVRARMGELARSGAFAEKVPTGTQTIAPPAARPTAEAAIDASPEQSGGAITMMGVGLGMGTVGDLMPSAAEMRAHAEASLANKQKKASHEIGVNTDDLPTLYDSPPSPSSPRDADGRPLRRGIGSSSTRRGLVSTPRSADGGGDGFGAPHSNLSSYFASNADDGGEGSGHFYNHHQHNNGEHNNNSAQPRPLLLIFNPKITLPKPGRRKGVRIEWPEGETLDADGIGRTVATVYDVYLSDSSSSSFGDSSEYSSGYSSTVSCGNAPTSFDSAGLVSGTSSGSVGAKKSQRTSLSSNSGAAVNGKDGKQRPSRRRSSAASRSPSLSPTATNTKGEDGKRKSRGGAASRNNKGDSKKQKRKGNDRHRRRSAAPSDEEDEYERMLASSRIRRRNYAGGPPDMTNYAPKAAAPRSSSKSGPAGGKEGSPSPSATGRSAQQQRATGASPQQRGGGRRGSTTTAPLSRSHSATSASTAKRGGPSKKGGKKGAGKDAKESAEEKQRRRTLKVLSTAIDGIDVDDLVSEGRSDDDEYESDNHNNAPRPRPVGTAATPPSTSTAAGEMPSAASFGDRRLHSHSQSNSYSRGGAVPNSPSAYSHGFYVDEVPKERLRELELRRLDGDDEEMSGGDDNAPPTSMIGGGDAVDPHNNRFYYDANGYRHPIGGGGGHGEWHNHEPMGPTRSRRASLQPTAAAAALQQDLLRARAKKDNPKLYVPIGEASLVKETQRLVDETRARAASNAAAEEAAIAAAAAAIRRPSQSVAVGADDEVESPTSKKSTRATSPPSSSSSSSSSSSDDGDDRYDSPQGGQTAFSMRNYLALAGTGRYTFLAHTIRPYDTMASLLATYNPSATRRNILDANFLRDRRKNGGGEGGDGKDEADEDPDVHINMMIHGIPSRQLRIPVPTALAAAHAAQAGAINDALWAEYQRLQAATVMARRRGEDEKEEGEEESLLSLCPPPMRVRLPTFLVDDAYGHAATDQRGPQQPQDRQAATEGTDGEDESSRQLLLQPSTRHPHLVIVEGYDPTEGNGNNSPQQPKRTMDPFGAAVQNAAARSGRTATLRLATTDGEKLQRDEVGSANAEPTAATAATLTVPFRFSVTFDSTPDAEATPAAMLVAARRAFLETPSAAEALARATALGIGSGEVVTSSDTNDEKNSKKKRKGKNANKKKGEGEKGAAVTKATSERVERLLARLRMDREADAAARAKQLNPNSATDADAERIKDGNISNASSPTDPTSEERQLSAAETEALRLAAEQQKEKEQRDAQEAAQRQHDALVGQILAMVEKEAEAVREAREAKREERRQRRAQRHNNDSTKENVTKGFNNAVAVASASVVHRSSTTTPNAAAPTAMLSTDAPSPVPSALDASVAAQTPLGATLAISVNSDPSMLQVEGHDVNGTLGEGEESNAAKNEEKEKEAMALLLASAAEEAQRMAAELQQQQEALEAEKAAALSEASAAHSAAMAEKEQQISAMEAELETLRGLLKTTNDRQQPSSSDRMDGRSDPSAQLSLLRSQTVDLRREMLRMRADLLERGALTMEDLPDLLRAVEGDEDDDNDDGDNAQTHKGGRYSLPPRSPSHSSQQQPSSYHKYFGAQLSALPFTIVERPIHSQEDMNKDANYDGLTPPAPPFPEGDVAQFMVRRPTPLTTNPNPRGVTGGTVLRSGGGVGIGRRRSDADAAQFSVATAVTSAEATNTLDGDAFAFPEKEREKSPNADGDSSSSPNSPAPFLRIAPAPITFLHAALRQRALSFVEWREMEDRVRIAEAARRAFQSAYDALAFAKLREWSRRRVTSSSPSMAMGAHTTSSLFAKGGRHTHKRLFAATANGEEEEEDGGGIGPTVGFIVPNEGKGKAGNSVSSPQQWSPSANWRTASRPRPALAGGASAAAASSSSLRKAKEQATTSATATAAATIDHPPPTSGGRRLLAPLATATATTTTSGANPSTATATNANAFPTGASASASASLLRPLIAESSILHFNAANTTPARSSAPPHISPTGARSVVLAGGGAASPSLPPNAYLSPSQRLLAASATATEQRVLFGAGGATTAADPARAHKDYLLAKAVQRFDPRSPSRNHHLAPLGSIGSPMPQPSPAAGRQLFGTSAAATATTGGGGAPYQLTNNSRSEAVAAAQRQQYMEQLAAMAGLGDVASGGGEEPTPQTQQTALLSKDQRSAIAALAALELKMRTKPK